MPRGRSTVAAVALIAGGDKVTAASVIEVAEDGSPYYGRSIGRTIIFCSCGFYLRLLSFFLLFPRLFSAVADWMCMPYSHARFWVCRFRYFGVVTPPIFQFSIVLGGRSYNSVNTIVLHCDV